MAKVRVGETTIYYEVQGRGDPVVLLHGFTETGRTLRALSDALKRDFRVITPDMPGYGRSGPQPRDYPVDFYERDARVMAAFLDALGLPAVHLGGFSDGAEVALWLAILRPAQVRSLVAWGVAGALNADALPEVGEIATLIDAPPPHWVDWRDRLCRSYGEAAARRMTAGWAAAVRDLISRGGDISLARAGEIRCPVLLVNGAEDRVNPPVVVRALAARIPQAELILVPDVGHRVHDAREAWFNGLVRDWLLRHARSTRP
ncbi:MAG TPA: alpha/beta hydrolase [Chloroflexia bacterium]|nr:alpha/beta hydrolase [Chloroflexia bacterium]